MKSRTLLAWLVVGAALTISHLAAQDVTVTDPAWMDRENPSVVPPPKFKKAPRFDYPDEMKKADVVGYVIVPEYTGANGESGLLGRKGTSPYFEKALEGDLPKISPALKDGKPVEGLWWYAAIFNPGSASAKAANAAPRLEYVVPVYVNKKLAPKGTKFPLIVWGVVSLDEKAVLQKVSLDDPAHILFQEAIQKALSYWRFSPARKDRQPVAGELRVPFFIGPPYSAPKQALNVTMPKVLYRENPVYPKTMKRSGLRGEVLVEFMLTKEGKIANPVVLKSNNPGFNEAAVDALMKWKFAPAMRDGEPAEIKMQLPLVFSMSGAGTHDYATVSQPSKKNQEKIPEQFRYDVAPKPQGVLTPVYPYALAAEKINGNAIVAFIVGEAGTVEGTKVIEASKPEFGLAMVAAVEAFSFIPAIKNGKPTRTILRMEHKFVHSGLEPTMTSEDRRLLSLETKHAEEILSAKKLDSPLEPVSQRSPVFPFSLLAQVERGEAKVEILIDEEGKVHLPRIVEATDPAFGYAAVQAIIDWRFEPPKAGGKPAIVRVLVPFEFKHETPGGKPAPVSAIDQATLESAMPQEKEP